MTVLNTPQQIDDARRLTLRQMLKLEMRGMKSRGRSAYSLLQSDYGYKGTREAVLKQLDAWRDALLNTTNEGESK